MCFPEFSELFYVFGKKELVNRKLKKCKLKNDNRNLLEIVCSGLMDVFYVPGCEPVIYASDAVINAVNTQRTENRVLIDIIDGVSLPDCELPFPVVLSFPELPKIALNHRADLYAFDVVNSSVDLTLSGHSTAKLFGRTQNLNVSHEGDGEVSAKLLISQNANLNITGKGYVHVTVVREIISNDSDKRNIKNYYRHDHSPVLIHQFNDRSIPICLCPNCQIRNTTIVN